MNSIRRSVLSSCGLALVAGSPTALWAQQTPPAAGTPSASTAPAAEGVALEEIVVTAEKRTENLQETPVTVTVLAAEQLSRSGVEDFTNITKLDPEVQVNNVVGSTNIGIRGIRAIATGPTNEAPVAVHIDGVYLSRATGLEGFFYDVDRIEVLKGPQGTLYGRNAVAGVINIITNKPNTDAFGVTAEVETGNYDLKREEASINMPINDSIAVRLAARSYRHDGYYAEGLDDADENSGRLQALIKFSDKIKLLLSGDMQTSFRNGPGNGLIGIAYRPASPNGTLNPPPPVTVPLSSDPFNADPLLYPQGRGPSREDEKTYGSMAQLDADLGFATWTTQFGNRRENLEQYNINLGAPPDGGQVGYSNSPGWSNTTSFETRLASNATTPFKYVVGAYYFTELNYGDMCAVASFQTPPTGPCLLDIGNPWARDMSYAAFGQLTWTPEALDKLHVTGGLRYNDDTKRANVYSVLFGTTYNYPGLQKTWVKTDYKVDISYDLTDRNMIYFDRSTGYKAGGFAYGSQPEYKPEFIQAWELGSKNRFFDDRLQVNGSAFVYNYENIQQNVTVPSPVPYLPFSDLTVTSIGRARYIGASTDTLFALTREDRIEAAVSYLDAKYVDFQIPAEFTASAPLNQYGQPLGIPAGDYSDTPAINAPMWSGVGAYTHTWSLPSGSLDGRVDIQWASLTHLSQAVPNSLEDIQQKTWAEEDVSLRYDAQTNGPKWNVTAYVHNLTDRRVLATGSYNTNGLITGAYQPPRTFGAILGVKF